MSKKKETENIIDFIIRLIFLYFIWLLFLLFINKQEFWKWLFIGLGIIVVIFFIWFLITRISKDRKEKLIKDVRSLSLEKDIDNFINISGKERGKEAWFCPADPSYGFYPSKMGIFIKILREKGLKIKNVNDLKYILTKFIEDKGETLMRGGFELKHHDFSLLSGTEFENLLVRLYETMEYIVEHPGGTGDQGADLILTKNGQRILIQAKCYNNERGVGNDSVQQALAAKNYYNCDKAIVIGIPYFTIEARQLAKTAEIELIDKKELQGLLLEHLKENWNYCLFKNNVK